MWRRPLILALIGCLAIFTASFILIWLQQGQQPTPFIRIVFWAGIASIPLIFILWIIFIIDWFLRHLHGFRTLVRHNRRLCLTCNYELRASTDRCPECGTPIPQSPPHHHPV